MLTFLICTFHKVIIGSTGVLNSYGNIVDLCWHIPTLQIYDLRPQWVKRLRLIIAIISDPGRAPSTHITRHSAGITFS